MFIFDVMLISANIFFIFIADEDYNSIDDLVTFIPGVTFRSFNVTLNDDFFPDTPEYFIVGVSQFEPPESNKVNIINNQTLGEILDEDSKNPINIYIYI